MKSHACVVPHVEFESEIELQEVCDVLLFSYIDLVHRVVTEKIRVRGVTPATWTELERLMFGITTFDEILDEALPLVLATTKGNGVLYAHDLNTRIIRCINKHNTIFFHETTSICEEELLASLTALLFRVLISSGQSHYNAILEENFQRLVAWDAHEWLVYPRHLVGEYLCVLVEVCYKQGLFEDLVLMIVCLLGFPGSCRACCDQAK